MITHKTEWNDFIHTVIFQVYTIYIVFYLQSDWQHEEVKNITAAKLM